MKLLALNLGAGGLKMGSDVEYDWINVDIRADVKADLVCNCKKLPYEDNSIGKILCIHMLEHLTRHEVPIALKEWYRLLIPGGVLEIEVPNFDLTIKDYLAGNEERMLNIYGRQDYSGDFHHNGFNFKRLSKMLVDIGFRDIKEVFNYSYHAQEEPCLRLLAEK